MLEEIVAYIKLIKSKNLKPIYFLYGTENYFIDRIIEAAEQVLFANKGNTKNTIFYDQDTSWQEIISCAKQYSLFEEFKLIIVNNAQNRNFIKQSKDLEILQEYLQAPAHKTILIIIYRGENLSINKFILKILEKKSCVFKLSKLNSAELHKFIAKYMAKRSFILEAETINFLISNTGNDLYVITKELEKIIINNKAHSKITIQDIEGNITNSQGFNIFDFGKMIIAKNVYNAFSMLKEYYLGKDLNITAIISILYTEFTKLLVIKSSASNSINVSIPYYIQNFYKTHAANYSYNKLIEIIHLLRIYDLKIKYATDETIKLVQLHELINFISLNDNYNKVFIK